MEYELSEADLHYLRIRRIRIQFAEVNLLRMDTI